MKWPTKKLGEIAECTDGDWILSKDLTTGRDVRLIQLGDIGEGVFLDKTDKWISRKRCDELNCTILKRGEILLARLGDPLAKACIFPGFDYPCITAVDVTIIRPGSEVEPRFLLQYLNSQFFKEQVNRVASGATRKRISRKNLENLQIPLPPLSEQKRIVEKIEKLFAKIDEAERLRAESLAASAALLPSALHQVFSRAKKGKLIKLGEVIKLQGGYAFKSRDYQKLGVPIVRIQNLQNENVDLSDAPCISLNHKKELQEYLLEENDILIAMSGATTGKIAIVKKKDLPALLNQRVGRFRIRDHSKISNDFLFWVVRIIQQKIFESAYGAAQPNISGKDIEKFQIPLPPLSEQKKIVAYLDALSQKSQELQKLQQQTAADFSALRQSILAQAFNQNS